MRRTYLVYEALVIGLLDERDDAARGGGRAAVVLAVREVNHVSELSKFSKVREKSERMRVD